MNQIIESERVDASPGSRLGEQKLLKKIHVEAKPDHLDSISRAKPINALSELVWNALDADADRIDIYVSDNTLGHPFEIEVRDNGWGIESREVDEGFGNLGGSWKRQQKHTRKSGRKMHGREGKGRFKAFSLGHRVEWDTVFVGADDQLYRHVIRGRSDALQDFSLTESALAPGGSPRGTRVKITNLVERLSLFSADGTASTQLAEAFAFYLRNYPSTQIVYRGERIVPEAVQKSLTTGQLQPFQAKDGTWVTVTVDLVEWNFVKKERKICLCDAAGFTLIEVDAGVRPGTDFNFTAYVKSDYLGKLHEGDLLALEGLDDEVRRILDGTKDFLRGHFRQRKAESASELVTQWKKEGVYPFSGEPGNAVEKAVREVFDICALNVHENLDSFRAGEAKDRQFTLRMLKTALDDNPASLKRILTEVLDLSKEKQNELADLLQFTSLSAIIAASRMVTERLQFLAGLEAILFGEATKKVLKERSQLHKLLEGETWIFGEEFALTSSDESLTTVLGKHISHLRPRKKNKQKPVTRDDGSSGIIDLLLGREIPAYAQARREFLVVELKRPTEPVSLEVKAQIESYGLAIWNDERFDKKNCSWTFLAVSNDITPEAASTLKQTGKAVGFFHDDPSIKIGLASWSEIINASRVRLDAFKKCLDYSATTDQGLAFLHSRYRKYMPSVDKNVSV